MIILRPLLVACALVGACVAYIPQRALCGDALMYAQLITGGVDVEAPFRYRVVVPWLARLLPLSAGSALAAISFASLVASYALVLLIAARLRIGFAAAVFGLCAAVASPAHLYNYTNPYLTDCLSLAVVSLCAYALVSARYGLFAGAAAFGMGVRESLVFVAFGWHPRKQWLRAGLCVLLALACRVAIRRYVGPSAHPDEGPFALFPAHTLGELVRETTATWHVLWVVAPLGIAFLDRQREALVWKAVPILLGAIFTSLLAADTARMFQPLFPFAALGCARFLELAWARSRAAAAGLVAACLGCSWVWQPVRIPQLGLAPELRMHAHTLAALVLLVAGMWAVWAVARARLDSEAFLHGAQ